MPGTACLTTSNSADTYVFSGYQYNWLSVAQQGLGSPPANSCAATLGANGNSAFIGLVYAPGASINVQSAYSFESAAVGGIIGQFITFTGTMPTIRFNSAYSPAPPASRLTN